jgi:hypothetical protein
VIESVKKALLAPLHEALTTERPASEAVLSRRKSSELSNYQAVKKHVLQARKSSFTTAALDSGDELRVAALLERAPDVVGWVYNHRSGVGYSIEYDWQGYQSRYFPDFIARAKFGEVFHNFIIEVKGRLDDRDKVKARRGRRYCELLTEYDSEPWHYLLLLENASEERDDISWWETRSSPEIFHVLKRHETLPLVPKGGSRPPRTAALEVLDSVAEKEQFQSALPVFDLAVAAGSLGSSQTPEPVGWARVQLSRPIDRRMFLARVAGQSMEDGISDGTWCAFRMYPNGAPPSPTALDGKRVIVQLRDDTDPDTGGRYTLKRWRVAQLAPDGTVAQIELRPDNPTYRAKQYSAKDGDLRAVAEFIEVVG